MGYHPVIPVDQRRHQVDQRRRQPRHQRSHQRKQPRSRQRHKQPRHQILQPGDLHNLRRLRVPQSASLSGVVQLSHIVGCGQIKRARNLIGLARCAGHAPLAQDPAKAWEKRNGRMLTQDIITCTSRHQVPVKLVTKPVSKPVALQLATAPS